MPTDFCSKVTLFGFAIPVGNFAALQQTCRKFFDIPSGGTVTCVPLDPVVLLLFDSVSWLGDKQIASYGIMESEALFQIPVQITKAGNPLPPGLFTPMILVDDPASLVGGREVFGYPKTFGTVSGIPKPAPAASLAGIPVPAPLGVSQPPTLTVAAYGANQNDLYLAYHTLIKVSPQAGPPLVFPALGLQGLLAGMFPLLQAATLAVVSVWSAGTTTPQFFLKQFPDIAAAGQTCFRQITSADYQVKIYSFQPITTLFNLEIQPLDTHDVCGSLGVPAQTLVVGFQSILDITLGNGKIVWQ